MATVGGQEAFGRWGAYFVSHLGGGYGNGWGARGNTEAITHQGRQIPPTHVIPAGFSV